MSTENVCSAQQKRYFTYYQIAAMIACFFFGIAVASFLITNYGPGACHCLEGSYIQTMKNCIASQDFNSSWCTVGWLK